MSGPVELCPNTAVTWALLQPESQWQALPSTVMTLRFM